MRNFDKTPQIAILGATSHIAKGLIRYFLKNGGFFLHLFARVPENVHSFLSTLATTSNNSYLLNEGYADFPDGGYDVIINCIGAGTLNKHKGDYTSYFTVTEEYDNLIVDYCKKNPDALYISLSSGAVYGRGHDAPVHKDSVNRVKVNQINPEDYYSIVRLYTESKHRAYGWLNIVDLRIFSYFSRFIDLADGYFITDVIDCTLNNKVLFTDNVNIIRDYLHPFDLFAMILSCIDAGKLNVAFDMISSKPVTKQEILDYFSIEYGLIYKVRQSSTAMSATGTKNIYCSRYNAAKEIGYINKYCSMDTIKTEALHILRP